MKITPRKSVIRRHTDLDVYKRAFDAAMNVFRVSKAWPVEERYSLTDQSRRSSRSVAANLAERWRKRRYPAAFVAKLSDAEGECAETQVWLQFAVECGYLTKDEGRGLYAEYDALIGMIVTMIQNSAAWKL